MLRQLIISLARAIKGQWLALGLTRDQGDDVALVQLRQSDSYVRAEFKDQLPRERIETPAISALHVSKAHIVCDQLVRYLLVGDSACSFTKPVLPDDPDQPKLTDYLQPVLSSDAQNLIKNYPRFEKFKPSNTGACLVLGYHFPIYNNYGHFLLDQLPALFFWKQLSRQGIRSILVIGIQKEYLRAKISQMIACLVPSDVEVIFRPYCALYIKKAVFPLGLSIHPSIKQPYLGDWFRQSVSARFRALEPETRETPLNGRRLFVSREDASDRKLENESDIFDGLSEYGFEKVLGSKLSLAESVKVFGAAEIVVGICGASLSNIVFCKRGTPLINICGPEMAGFWYKDLADVLGHDYVRYEGDTLTSPTNFPGERVEANFSVNIDELRPLVDSRISQLAKDTPIEEQNGLL